MKLTHYGRKSGKPYDVTIWFVVEGDRVYLGTANVNRQWVRNVQKTPTVHLLIGSEHFEGQARFITDPVEHQRTTARMRRKYWMYWPVFAVVQVLKPLGLVKDQTGSFEVILKD